MILVETENQRCPEVAWICPDCGENVPENLGFVIALHITYCPYSST